MYHNYTNARDNAWRYLIRHKVKKLPVDVFELCRRDKIFLLPYSTQKAKDVADILGIRELMDETDGFTTQVKKKPMIFWDDSKPITRQRFTVAHEIGHIMNGDTGPTKWNREPTENDYPEETAANIIASRILAPASVLWALDVHDAETIAELCGISQTAAEWRCKRMELLYEREKQFLAKYGKSCFLMSPLEQKVHRQFRTYIARQKRD